MGRWVASCQIVVSVHAMTDTAPPLYWSLFVPTARDDHAVDAAGRPDVVASAVTTNVHGVG
nr:hypothetical protein [Micromonospora echinaurantiaca]